MHSGTHDQRTLTPALLGLVWSAMFGFSGFFLSYSTMVSIGAADGLSTVTGGAVLTTMMVGVIAVQPFAPWLGAVLGMRGSLLVALGLQVLGQVLGLVVAPPLLSLVLAGVFGGMGFGFFVVLANAAVPGTVSASRLGKALGIFGGVTALAAAVGAPFGLWLIGFVPEWSFRLIACATLLLAVPTLIIFLPGREAVGEQAREPGEAAGSDGPVEGSRVSDAGSRDSGAGSRGPTAADDPTDPAARDGAPGPADQSGVPIPPPAEIGPRTDADAHASGGSSTAASASVNSSSGGTDSPHSSTMRRRTLAEVAGLIVMLLPFLVGMVIFGLIVGFGPGRDVASPAIYIGIMQLFAVLGRFVAGAIADVRSPLALNLVGAGLTAAGLIATSVTTGGVVLGLAMAVVGFGLGTLQSASLVMAFAAVSTPARASVAWNMHFDIGLGIAGVIGGVGFTYLGDTATFLACTGVLLLTGLVSWVVANTRTNR